MIERGTKTDRKTERQRLRDKDRDRDDRDRQIVGERERERERETCFSRRYVRYCMISPFCKAMLSHCAL